MKKLIFIALCSVFITSCSPTNSLRPDEVLLDQSQNNLGEGPANFDDLIKAPEKSPFRLKELDALEELIKSQQTSRAKIREAVYIGKSTEALLNGPFSRALESGLKVQPGERVHIFWPNDVVNDFIKVKNSRGDESWLKYRDQDAKVQVVLLEDFIIPKVKISDSRLIIISEARGDEKKEDIILISDEEEKKIEPPSPNPEEEQEEKEEPPIEVDLGDSDDEGEVEDEEEPQAPVVEESGSPFAPDQSPAPIARPPRKKEDPPLSGAVGMSPQELLDALGIKETHISSKEAAYLKSGVRKISEVFGREHKTFSACTFNPAQGSRTSKCYRKLVLSEEFAGFLEDEGMSCAKQAAKLVFEKEPLKVLLRTNGGSLNRGSKGLRSLHDRGRALDVFKTFLYFEEDSKPEEIVFHINSTDGSSPAERRNRNFYWSFAACWEKKIKEYHQTKACGSQGSGFLTYLSNKDHHNHMHISLPVCRKVRKKFNLRSTQILKKNLRQDQKVKKETGKC